MARKSLLLEQCGRDPSVRDDVMGLFSNFGGHGLATYDERQHGCVIRQAIQSLVRWSDHSRVPKQACSRTSCCSPRALVYSIKAPVAPRSGSVLSWNCA